MTNTGTIFICVLVSSFRRYKHVTVCVCQMLARECGHVVSAVACKGNLAQQLACSGLYAQQCGLHKSC